MKNIRIQKTPTGYVLRHGRATKLMTLILCAFFGIVPTVMSILLFFMEGTDPSNLLPAMLGMVIMWASSAYLFSLAFGFRIVVDEAGVHRYSFGRVKLSLLWRYVRSFGIGVIHVACQRGTTNRLAFYASTEEKPVDYKSTVFIWLTKTDEQAIRESGLLNFCRRQMAEADRKFR